jgi:hypothetical protein
MATFTRIFPGSATLEETRRACKKTLQAETANLTKIEPVKVERSDGTKTNHNEATFETADDILDVKDDLRFFDVSTTAGATAAAAVQNTHRPIGGPGRKKIFVSNKLTEVELFSKTS